MPGTNQSPSPKVATPKTKKTTSHGRFGGGSRRSWLETFNLHSMNDASLKRMIDCIGASSAGRYRTCVISIISKESLGQAVREQLVENIIQQRHKQTSATPDDKEPNSVVHSEPFYENQLLGQVDVHEGLVVLNLESFLGVDKLLSLCEESIRSAPSDISEQSKLWSICRNTLKNLPADSLEAKKISSTFETTLGSPETLKPLLMWPSTWPGWNQNLLKTLLIIFTLSNIVVFYNPEPSIDYSLIRLLRILEIQRSKSQSRICDLLATIASGQVFSQQWIRTARISCPRAIFVCDTSQLDIDIGDYHEARIDLEDQIAYLLKKTGLLQTLLSIPDNEDFVYIFTKQDTKSISMMQEAQQVDLSSQSKEQPDSQCELTSLPLSESGRVRQREAAILRRPGQFRKFIMRHVSSIQSLANTNQDHDGKPASGKQVARAHIIPRFDDFFNVLLGLKCLLFPPSPFDEEPHAGSQPSKPDWSKPDERRFIDVYDLSNVDTFFSRQHCQKARLAAMDLYVSGLQVGQCDEQAHKDLLESTKSFYINHARGPAISKNLDLLLKSCNAHWQETLEANKLAAVKRDNSVRSPPGGNKPHKSHSAAGAASASMRPLAVTRKPNGSIRVASSCQCGHETNLIIKPSDRRKKLERLDVYQIND